MDPLARVAELERENRELRRANVILKSGAVLADTHDEWLVDERRYLSEASMAKLHPDRDTDTVTAIQGSDR